MSDFKYILPPNEPKIIKDIGDVGIVPTITENISRSLRFNGSNAYLNRTLTQGGSTTTATLSMWFKRSRISGTNYGDMLFHTYNTGVGAAPGNYNLIFLTGSSTTTTDYLAFNFRNTGSFYSQGFYRDPSAWYHLVINYDSTNSIQSERFRFYINGVRGTWLTGYVPAFALNYEFESTLGNTGAVHNLGWYWYGGYDYYLNGYMADVHFIDGQALLPTDFATTDNRTNSWVAKKYRGSYGNNGYNLKFEDNSGVTAATLGKDSSGKGNNWTPNNFSVTAGAGNDSLVDSPTNYGTDTGVGGQVRGNYCTLSSIDKGTEVTLAKGNLNITWSGVNGHSARSTHAISSGKWYWEVTSGANSSIGIIKSNIVPALNGWPGQSTYGATGSYAYAPNGSVVTNGTYSTYGSAMSNGSIVGVAYDATNGRIFFSLNGTWQASGDPVAGTNPAYSSITGEYSPAIGYWTSPTSNTNSINFGQRPFAYTAPTGFKALCTTNLPIPRIKKPSLYFDAVTYTGTGATQSITGLGFSPDLLWTKGRSLAQSNNLFDTLRIGKRLRSDTTGEEALTTVMLDSNGFTLGTETESNNSGSTFVAWAWDAGNSTVTNTSGSITSTVRANPQNGVSIVGYTGNGTAGATVGHGLGVSPSMIIAKKRSTATSSQWTVGFSALGWNKYILLNTTGAAATDSNVWNSAPTSSVFYLGNDIWNNHSGQTTIAYCFSEFEGFSKFGSYTGNGSTDGPFLYFGFRPRWIMYKRTDSTGQWNILDTSRSPINAANTLLRANLSNADETNAAYDQDFLSNGWKIRSTNVDINSSGATHIFAAFAESPFRYANAR